MSYTPPTKAQLQDFIDACDVDSIRELHEAARKEVTTLEWQFSVLSGEQTELSRQANSIEQEYNKQMAPIFQKRLDIKQAKNKLDIMIKEHKQNAQTIYSALFAAIDRKKQQPR